MRDTPDAVAPYRKVAAEIAARIAAGDLHAGERVPSTREIVNRWGVAMATASKALAELRHQGLVRVVPGVGTVVAPVREDGLEPPPTVADLLAPGAARSSGPPLTQDRVVGVAVRLADRNGLAQLTMAQVARALGVTTMALYRHVPDRAAMVDAMVERAVAEVATPSTSASTGERPGGPEWRRSVMEWAADAWAAYSRHRWLAAVARLDPATATAARPTIPAAAQPPPGRPGLADTVRAAQEDPRHAGEPDDLLAAAAALLRGAALDLAALAPCPGSSQPTGRSAPTDGAGVMPRSVRVGLEGLLASASSHAGRRGDERGVTGSGRGAGG